MGAGEAGGSTLAQGWAWLQQLVRWAVRSYVLVLIIGIVLGLQVAPVVSDVVQPPNEGTVAVIPLSGAIDGSNAQSVVDRLEQADRDPEIDAVVLWLNSGGGGASPSESIYLKVRRVAGTMPVVVSVDSMAASGAYYAAAPADVVYAKPSSLVGSIGVYLTVPQQYEPIEDVIQSGPNKLGGADRREWFYKTEAVTRAFLNAVETHRDDRLALSREELAYAKLYTGSEAVSHGLADDIGGMEAAIERAAQEAGLARHDVRILGYGTEVRFLTRSNYVAADATEKRLVEPGMFVGSPADATAPTLVMLPPSVVHAAVPDAFGVDPANTTEVSQNGTPTP